MRSFPRRRPPARAASVLGLALFAVVPLVSIEGRARAQDEAPEERVEGWAGWSALYLANGGMVVSRAPAAAFALDAGETIHPEIAAEGFHALFAGDVDLPREGSYRFGVEVEGGDATLELRDRSGAVLARVDSTDAPVTTSDWVRMERGPVRVEVRFVRSGGERTRLRTTWELEVTAKDGFRMEPVPSRSVKVPAEDRDAVAEELAARRGRILLEEKGCVQCHDAGDGGATAVGRRVAPKLEGCADRISAAWIERWVRAPHAIRSGADMPALFRAGPEEEMELEALLAYLGSLRAPGSAPPKEDASEPTTTAKLGRKLYHGLGCVPCHGALTTPAEIHDDPFLPSSTPAGPFPAPFGDLRGKWKRAALARFLLDPLAVYPDGRMPGMKLSEEEAGALAEYLLLEWDREGPSPDPARVARGAEAFENRGCAACHEVVGRESTLAAAPLAELDGRSGCIAPNPEGRAPWYDLTGRERDELRLGMASVARSRGIAAPIDRLERTLASASCTSCHVLDGRGGPDEETRFYFIAWDDIADLGDEGRLAPDLSGVGFKLSTSWMDAVLTDGGAARPYLATRMPQFGHERLGSTAEAFAQREGIWPRSDANAPPITDELVLNGRALMGREALTCVSCHVFADYPPAGTVGPDITAFAERLRYEWWRSYMPDPQRYKPGSRMPTFASGRDSTYKAVCEGDIFAQTEAMWAYFTLGEAMPPPDGLQASTELKIDVGARPVVLRTFLQNAGSRGIAVGHPVGIHFGFDATGVRLVEAWRGDFLDASGAWAGRGGQVTGGRGPVVWSAPAGPPLRTGASPDRWPDEIGREAGYRFRGYSLDADGVPTFHYEAGALSVRETIHPAIAPREHFVRELEVRGARPGEELWLNAGSRARLRELGGARPGTERTVDGSTWYQLRAEASDVPISIAVEVTL